MKNKSWLALFITLAITSFVFGWVQHADAHSNRDTKRLIDTIKPFLNPNSHISLKYTGYYGTCENSSDQLLDAGRELSKAFELPASTDLTESNSHPIYQAQTETLSGADVKLTVAVPQGQAACYTVLSLDAADNQDEEKLIKWQEAMDEELDKLQIEGQWNVMVQGIINEELFKEVNPEQMLTSVIHDLKGTPIETYTDNGTLSVSLASENFHTAAKSGEHSINLQAALHKDSTSKEWRLTVGTPIITMEY